MPLPKLQIAICFLGTVAVALGAALLVADPPKAEPPKSAGEKPATEKSTAEKPGTAKSVDGKSAATTLLDKPTADDSDIHSLAATKEIRKLADNVWVDTKRKWVILEGQVCLREGPPLEMFACLAGTKEHESVVSIETKAYMVHAALLAVGARPGTPVKFDPKYQPATGPLVDIFLYWTDKAGKPQRARAQDWVRNMKTKKAMEHPWVFAGSFFHVDAETGERRYMAEGGELICVSNFSSATLDLPVASSQSAEELLFDAFTERIPTEGTKVRVALMPRLEPEKKADKK